MAYAWWMQLAFYTLPISIVLVLAIWRRRYPPINDISTDTRLVLHYLRPLQPHRPLIVLNYVSIISWPYFYALATLHHIMIINMCNNGMESIVSSACSSYSG
jgi:hypothetical protein